MENIDPDDTFSRVPYEKGFQLLYYLETEVVKSEHLMNEYLKDYVKVRCQHLHIYVILIQYLLHVCVWYGMIWCIIDIPFEDNQYTTISEAFYSIFQTSL
jgi:hypothetical protein